jgi:hypothetical protein
VRPTGHPQDRPQHPRANSQGYAPSSAQGVLRSVSIVPATPTRPPLARPGLSGESPCPASKSP